MTPFTVSELLRAREGLSVDKALGFDRIANEVRGIDAAVAMLDSMSKDLQQWSAVYPAPDLIFCTRMGI